VLAVVNNIVSTAVITVLFALIFKYLPDAHPAIAWKDIWVGSLITAILFTAGKFGIGLYLGRSSVGSAYGAAGSLVLLLVWVYYSAQILFFGAEITQVYARRHGSRLGMETARAEGGDEGQGEEPSARDAGRVVPGKKASGSRGPRPAREEDRPAAARVLTPDHMAPPRTAVGRGLAWSVALLLLGFINKKKGWPA
jgi:hypothetical protein